MHIFHTFFNLTLFSDCSGNHSQPCSLQPLKEAISVLFSFTRRVLDDTQFQADIHHWLERLVYSHADHCVPFKHSCSNGPRSFCVFCHAVLLYSPGGNPSACWWIRRASIPAVPSSVLPCWGWKVGFTIPSGECSVCCSHVSGCMNNKQIMRNFLLNSQIQIWGNAGGVHHFMQALTILMSPAR